MRQGSWRGYPRIILPVFIAFISVPLGDGEQQRCGARDEHLEMFTVAGPATKSVAGGMEGGIQH